MLDSMTKWIVGWKRKGWKTAGGDPVKNQDLVKALDAEIGAARERALALGQGARDRGRARAQGRSTTGPTGSRSPPPAPPPERPVAGAGAGSHLWES